MFTEEKILSPYDIFEGLADVHDQVPYEDHSSSHSTINVPKPEAGNKTIMALEKQIRKTMTTIAQITDLKKSA